MVALSSTPSTSTAKPKKTRRSQKKKGPAAPHAEELEDVDDDMDDGLLPTDTTGRAQSGIDPQAATEGDADDVVMIDPSAPETTSAPAFPPLPAAAQASTAKSETRRIPIPPHRMTPLQKDWINIFSPLTEMCGLQVRMNVQRKCVEMRVSSSGPFAANLHTDRAVFAWFLDIQAHEGSRCIAARGRFRKSVRVRIRRQRRSSSVSLHSPF
jgi:hypothetical protein